MNIWWILRTEMRRLIRSRIGRAAMVVGVIIPLLYSSLYLHAFWDPYENLDEFPVAIVNLDKGGERAGEAKHAGQQIVEELLAGQKFKYVVTSAEEATAGLEDGRYYVLLNIPERFTQDLLSIDSENPHKPEIAFVANEGQNYIASTIASRLQSTLREEVGNSFTKEFFRGIFDVIGDAGNGLTEAADGATQLADGSTTLHNGLGELDSGVIKLVDGTHTLAVKTGELQTGATKVADGAEQLATGTQQVAAGSQKLAAGTRQLDEQVGAFHGGATKLATGAQDLATGSTQLASGLQQTTTGVQQVRDALQSAATTTTQLRSGLLQAQAALGTVGSGTPGATGSSGGGTTANAGTLSVLDLLTRVQQQYGLQTDPHFQRALQTVQGVSAQLGTAAQGVVQSQQGLTTAATALNDVATAQATMVAGAQELAQGSTQLAQGAAQLATGADQLKQGTTTLTTETGNLATGSQQLVDGAKPLAVGTRQLATGTSQLASGTTSLAVGTDDLRTGTTQLLDGSQELADGNRKLADELTRATADSTVQHPDQKAELMANPLDVVAAPVHPVSTYGMGFASYFIPLSLWVGALVLYFILSMKEYRWLMAPVSSTSIVLGKFFTLGLIGIGQAVLSSLVLTEVLGLQVLHLPAFYLFNILLSLTSIAIIGLLIARFGSGAGRFFSIVLLILQLTSSAGTFPLEMVPDFFQAIHPFLPMSYGIEGLRSIIAIGDEARIWRDLAVIATVLVAVLAVQVLTTRRTLRVADLHEQDKLHG